MYLRRYKIICVNKPNGGGPQVTLTRGFRHTKNHMHAESAAEKYLILLKVSTE